MILKFATKRSPNGYRKYLALDTDRKQYATESWHWYSRDDITEISNKDRHRIMEEVEKAGYSRIDYI